MRPPSGRHGGGRPQPMQKTGVLGGKQICLRQRPAYWRANADNQTHRRTHRSLRLGRRGRHIGQRSDRRLRANRQGRAGADCRVAAARAGLGRVRDGQTERHERLPAARPRLSVLRARNEPAGGAERVGRPAIGRRYQSGRGVRQPVGAEGARAERGREAGEGRSVRDGYRRDENPPDRLRSGPRPARRPPVTAIAQRLSRRIGVAATADPSGVAAKADRNPAGAKADLLLIMLAGAHAAVLMAAPSAPVIAIGLWWNANTISHYFIHRPFFRRRGTNRAFAAYLSVLLGFPHSLWRDRHLAHHAGVAARPRLSRDLVMQAGLVLTFWSVMVIAAPLFFLSVYLPGWAAGLLLCGVHGYYEHAHGTTSHYGRLYNLLLFNDGFHVVKHAHPSAHWTRLAWHYDSFAC